MLNKDKYILPSNGMLGYPKYVTIRAMTGRELSMVYSTLNEAVINEVITKLPCISRAIYIRYYAEVRITPIVLNSFFTLSKRGS